MSHAKPRKIPDEVKKKVQAIIERFNQEYSRRDDCFYTPRFRGKYLYLDRSDYGRMSPTCRLTYTGDFENWDFAIFKWSSESYDPGEWMFPGSGEVDGTLEGAMKAGLEAYPV